MKDVDEVLFSDQHSLVGGGRARVFVSDDEQALRRSWLYARHGSHLRQKSQHSVVSLSNRMNPDYTGAVVSQLNERGNVFRDH